MLRLRVKHSAVLATLLVATVVVASCKTFVDYNINTRMSLDARQLDLALANANKALGVKNKDALPKDLGKYGALFILDRAMVLQALGDYPQSSVDLQVADKAIEILDFRRSTADEIGRYMFSDNIGPYKARPYEKLLLNSINMINYLARHNVEGAKVEARRFAIMRAFLFGDEKEVDPALVQATGPGSYLAGYAFEKAGQLDEAMRYYKEAEQAGKYPAVPTSADQNTGELLITMNYGRVPEMQAKRLPIGLAISIGAIFLPPGIEQQARRMAGQGLVTWVNLPTPVKPVTMYAEPRVFVDDKPQSIAPITDIDALTTAYWEAAKGRVIAAAITRTITRAAIGAGVGVATGQASDRSGLGVFAALLTQGALVAADKPDTRSWATLPARMTSARVTLPAGVHQVRIEMLGRTTAQAVNVQADDWAVLNVTDLSQN